MSYYDQETEQFHAELQERQRAVQEELRNRETLRHSIKARQHLIDLELIAFQLLSGNEATMDPDTLEVRLVPLDKERRQQLKAASEVKLALLKKVVPDIKHVELVGAGGEDLGESRTMAVIELRNRLRAILTGQSLPAVIEGERVEEQEYECLR